jgi:peptidyl-prolyl cis-trans isomerase SurA
MKKFALLLIAIFVFLSPLLAQQPGVTAPAVSLPDAKAGDSQDRVVEEIVARVNNSIITRADLRRNKAQSEQDARDQNLSEAQIKEREQNALRDLIDQQLLIQKANELGISADAEVVKRLDELRKQMKVESLEELQKLAETQGVSWEEFKQNIKNSVLSQKVLGAEVGSHIALTQTELQKYYDEHKSDFSQPERVRLSEILIANDPKAAKDSRLDPSPVQIAEAEAKANQIYEQLKGGAKFDELARKESNGATAEQGGDLGYFKRNDLAKQLETQTFSLKAGEFTKPVHTRQGFIILLVNDHIEAGTPPFERVREQIQDTIYTQKIQPALREYLVKLRSESYISVKPGYTDTGATPNHSEGIVWATDAGPRTKQVRSKMGLGKKKTVLVGGDEKEAFRREEQMKRKEVAGDRSDGKQASAAKSSGAEEAKSGEAATNSRGETRAQEKARWEEEDRQDKLARKHRTDNGKEAKPQAEAKADSKDTNAKPAKAEKVAKAAAKNKKTKQAKADKKDKNGKGSAKSDSTTEQAAHADAKQADATQAEPKQADAKSEATDSSEQSDAKQASSTQADADQQADSKPEKKKKISWF